MDIQFFSKRLLVIARYRHQGLWLRREKLYYFKYIRKLNNHLKTLGYSGAEDITKAMNYIRVFEKKESKRVRNGFFSKPSRILGLACADTRDVLNGMKRFEGVCGR